MSTHLVVDNASKSFNNKEILHNINLTIGSQNLIILGENGVGKSLLLNMLSGLIAPTSGTVTLNDDAGHHNMAADAKARAIIGYQSDALGLWPLLTVSESLHFFASLNPVVSCETNALIELYRLGDVKNQRIKYLSEGYRKRLNLAIALSGAKPFILLDEPTNALDPIECALFIDLIKQQSQKSTIIMATHRIEEAIELGGDAIILYQKSVAYQKTISPNLEEDYHAVHQ